MRDGRVTFSRNSNGCVKDKDFRFPPSLKHSILQQKVRVCCCKWCFFPHLVSLIDLSIYLIFNLILFLDCGCSV